jgi:hypothetical protein
MASSSLFADLPALLPGRWFSPEDSQVDVGEAVGKSLSDRTFNDHGCPFWVGTVVWRKLLRQSKSPSTDFIHQRSPFCFMTLGISQRYCLSHSFKG